MKKVNLKQKGFTVETKQHILIEDFIPTYFIQFITDNLNDISKT